MATDAQRAAIERELAMFREAAGGRREPRLGCSTVSHDRLGYCTACTREKNELPLELLGWRLLALRESLDD